MVNQIQHIENIKGADCPANRIVSISYLSVQTGYPAYYYEQVFITYKIFTW